MTERLEPYATLRRRGITLDFFLGDCLQRLPLLSPGSVDVVVTSPPYNLGIKYRSYEDTLPRDRYLAWTADWVAAVRKVLSPAGSLFLNVGAKPTDPWVAMDIAQAVRPHLTLQNTIHWVKSIVIEQQAAGAEAGLSRDLAVGHYKPINSPRFVNDCHEFIFHFTPSGDTPLERTAIGVPYQDASNIGRWRAASGGLRCRGNAWFLPYDTINSREKDRPHPATFPARLPGTASGCTGWIARASCSTRSPGSAAPRWRARSSAWTSSGSISTRRTSTRPSHAPPPRWTC